MAALVEGEGCISIGNPKLRNNPERFVCFLRVTITNTSLPLLKFCKKKFGGTLKSRFMNPKRKNRYQRYVWEVRHLKAAMVLTLIYPYLISKRKQALLGMKFQKRKKQGRNKEKDGTFKRLLKRERDIRRNMYLRMKNLKTMGRIKVT